MKYVLGVNAGLERTHDSSACLFRKGKLIAFAEEERFIRKKHAYNLLPHNAIRFCLNEGKIDVNEIEKIAVSWDFPKFYSQIGKKFPSKNNFKKKLFPKKYYKKVSAEIVYVNHHLAHASSAFRCSGFNKSAVLIIDGQGEDFSTSIWVGEGKKIKFVKGFDIFHSIGYLYEAASKYLGFRLDQSGKTMGLSAYGKKKYDFEDLIKFIPEGYILNIKEKLYQEIDFQKIVSDSFIKYFEKKIGPKNKRIYLWDERDSIIDNKVYLNREDENFAASIQEIINRLFIHLSKIALKLTGTSKLCIAGGVGLNCVGNGKILEENICDELYVQPIANDAGTSIGAAMEILSNEGEDINFKMDDVYYGPNFSNKEIEKIIEKNKLNYEYLNNPSKTVAKMIYEGKIIGWFQGKMEGGPRALGNRSILADPTNPKIKDFVNEVKFREKWRPLCPSIIEEVKEKYLEFPYDSPFMTINFKIKKDKIEKIPSAVHIDGTARVQTVSKKTNALYWDLISEFGKLSGEQVILNTSMNSKGEPIVCSPNDAIKNFYTSQMDALVMGNYLIEK